MSTAEMQSAAVPVALIIFNRADTTRKVLDVLRKVRPRTLFVIADGPRPGVPDDERLCAEARAVIDEVDWPCEVRRRFLDANLGCGHGPAQGLAWVFSQVDECIILEDDCAPDITFFQFCREMLERYRDDRRIMMVSGNNHLLGKKTIADSYFYSINTQTHGWATWRRAWKEYDFYISDWPAVRSLQWLTNHLGNKEYARWWLKLFDRAYQEAKSNPKCSYWDFQWTYTCWKNHALNVIPSSNLVTNLGYGDNATHPTPLDHPLANLSVGAMRFPLQHPPALTPDYEADRILSETVYCYRSLYKKVFYKMMAVAKKVFTGKACK